MISVFDFFPDSFLHASTRRHWTSKLDTGLSSTMKIEEEFDAFDQAGSWAAVYHKIRQDSLIEHEYSVKDSKRAEFKGRNRYRDVSPYDHSRVKLQKDSIDYINASLIEAPDANRSYILTQGPLPNTSGHFWLMVWENDSKAILMLNRIIEKGQVKCHQYFPMGTVSEDEDEKEFTDVGLKVSYICEESANFFVIRTLEITDMETDEKKRVLQFHYTTWPDFGVPESPKEFLHFLLAVRESGALHHSVGPPVIHCSAGIGRSGTFCLVDTCLVLLEKCSDPESIKVCDILMDMRRFRMGLIQTMDQLRFSYMAIIEGCQLLDLLPDSQKETGEENDLRVAQNGDSVQDASDMPATSPPSPYDDMDIQAVSDSNQNKAIKRTARDVSGTAQRPVANANDGSLTHTQDLDSNSPSVPSVNGLQEPGRSNMDTSYSEETSKVQQFSQEIRRRNREDRQKKTSEQIARMKQKQQECEKWKIRRQTAKPYLWGLSLAILAGSYLLYRYYC